MRRLARGLAEVAALIVALLLPVTISPGPAQTVEIHVRGNQLVDGDGRRVRLLGVNRSGTEYACVVGDGAGIGIFGGPHDEASIDAIRSWRVNAVRVSLNEDCWLGINGLKPAYSGAVYRSAILDYVERLHDAGMVVIVDLHWNAPGTTVSTGQQLMADADHARDFWSSVATSLADDPGVMFDLYNEPNGISWSCWRDGCTTSEGWAASGMQTLIDAIRQTGAKQPIIVSGLDHANDLSGWSKHALHDPLDQLVAGVHVYDDTSKDYCGTVACWNRTVRRVAKRVPVVTTELGQRDGKSDRVDAYTAWADRQWRKHRSVSIIAWAWDAAQGEGGPSLIESFDGTPTPYGRWFRDYLEHATGGGLRTG